MKVLETAVPVLLAVCLAYVSLLVIGCGISNRTLCQLPDDRLGWCLQAPVVPEQYRQMMTQYVGKFHGEFDQRKMNLTVDIDNGGLLLAIRDANGGQNLIPKCRSIIGRLLEITLDESRPAPMVARFELSGAACKLPTQYIELQFKDRYLRLAVVRSEHREFSCGGATYANGRMVSPGTCNFHEVVDSWLTGLFFRDYD